MARARRRALAELIGLTSISQTDCLRVEGIAPVSAIPPTAELVRLATTARPDLAACRLGLQIAERDVELASRTTAPGSDIDRLFQPYEIAQRPEGTRAVINVRQTETQRLSLEEAIRKDVEQRHRECVASLRESREVANQIEKERRVYEELERKYEGGTVLAKEVNMTLAQVQKLERRQWELLVQHRRRVLALNTAVGVRLFP